MLQISADTGSGTGIINEMFPDELFENDARFNGPTLLINSEVSDQSIYNNSQQSQVSPKARKWQRSSFYANTKLNI